MAEYQSGQNEKKKSSFVTRLISGIVLVLLAVVIVPTGGDCLLALTYLISMIGLFELYRVFGIEKKSLGIVGYLTNTVYYLLILLDLPNAYVMMMILSLMALMTFYVLTYPAYKISDIAVAFMCVVYAGMMLSFLYLTRMQKDGIYVVWLIFISSWGTDTSAYCTGILFGRHKMTPILSPKKTVEGAVGGVLGAGLLGGLYAGIVSRHFSDFSTSVLICVLSSMVGALISMVGDLTASGIKRDYGIKDYGKVIPGHGGIMDRFDSMIFTAPAVYFALLLLRQILR